MIAMNKEEKIFDIRMKQISSIDKNTTGMIYRMLAAVGILFIALLQLDKLTNPFWIIILLAAVIAVLVVGTGSDKYLSDCYDWLAKTVRDGKLLTEKVPMNNSFGLIFYRKKYSF